MRSSNNKFYKFFLYSLLTLNFIIAFGYSNKINAAEPEAATLLSPSGAIYENLPSYNWNVVVDSTWYYLWVNDSTGEKIKKWYSSQEAGCESGTSVCSITPNTPLASGNGTWWVQTWNDDGYGPWSEGSQFTVAEAFSKASIRGTYAFTAMEQGGGVGITGSAVPMEAAAGIMTTDGNGNATGTISWNMYDLLDQVPESDRLVLHRFPITGEYTLEEDGFGTMGGFIDFDFDGNVDMAITGKLVVTKATSDHKALEFWYIGDEPGPSGSIIIMHFFKRVQQKKIILYQEITVIT